MSKIGTKWESIKRPWYKSLKTYTPSHIYIYIYIWERKNKWSRKEIHNFFFTIYITPRRFRFRPKKEIESPSSNNIYVYVCVCVYIYIYIYINQINNFVKCFDFLFQSYEQASKSQLIMDALTLFLQVSQYKSHLNEQHSITMIYKTLHQLKIAYYMPLDINIKTEIHHIFSKL